MTYRDDVEALKQRLDEAERENEALRAENAALKRGIAPKVIDAGKILGVPTRIRVERTLDGEMPASAHKELATIVRSAIGSRGSVISLGSTLVVRVRGNREARMFELRVTAKDGKTRISIDEKLGQVAGGILGGVGGGLGIGGLSGIFGPLLMTFGLMTAFLAAPFWLLGSVALARWLYATIAKRRETAHIELVAKLAEAALRAIDARRPASAARIRVESAETPEAKTADGAPAEAEAPGPPARRTAER
jgi:hypothetical protein